MNLKTIITFSIFLLLALNINAQETKKKAGPNKHILHVIKLQKEKKYQEIIDYLLIQIKTQKTNQLYYRILSGSYSKLNDAQNSFVYLMRGYLQNPTTLYARNKLHTGIVYLENNFKSHKKFPWLAKYYKIKSLFDANKLIEAEKLALELLKDKTNIDLTVILCKDIKTIKGNASTFDSTLRQTAEMLGDDCPEFIYFELGELLFNAGKYKHALKPLSKSIKMNPERRRSGSLYGASLLYTGKYPESNASLAATLKTFPKFREARLYYALSFWALNKHMAATGELNLILNKETPTKILNKAKSALKVIQAGEVFLTPDLMREVMQYLPKGQDPFKEIKKKLDTMKKKAEENKTKEGTEKPKKEAKKETKKK